MAYETLRQLYYGDEAAYEHIYESRFSSEYAVKLDFEVAGHQAFFVETPEAVRLLADILRKDKAVALAQSRLPAHALGQYSRKCLIDEVVLTNNMEGVAVSRKEIGDVLRQLAQKPESHGKKEHFRGLAARYLALMGPEPVAMDSCGDIRGIYDDLVLRQVVDVAPARRPDGRIFRQGPAPVRNAAGQTVREGVYPESAVTLAMEKALTFLHDGSVEKLYRVCVFHYLVAYIHPFYDGNGRLGRYLTSCGLRQVMQPLTAYRLSEVIRENTAVYYKMFEVCGDAKNRGDLTPFLLLMLRLIHTAVTELCDGLERRAVSLGRYEKKLRWWFGVAEEDGKLTEFYYILVQAALFGEAGVSTGELREHFGLSYGAVKSRLDQVQKQGLLRLRKNGREKYYSLDLERFDSLLALLEG